MCGKWHMGDDDDGAGRLQLLGHNPGRRRTLSRPRFCRERRAPQDDRATRPIWSTDFALDFLGKQKRDHPFYLLVPFYAPHTPFDYQPEVVPQALRRLQVLVLSATHRRIRGRIPDHRSTSRRNEKACTLIRRWSPAWITTSGESCRRLEEMGVRENTAGDLHGRPGLECRPPRRLGQGQRHRAVQYVRGIVARAADLESSGADPRPGRP